MISLDFGAVCSAWRCSSRASRSARTFCSSVQSCACILAVCTCSATTSAAVCTGALHSAWFSLVISAEFSTITAPSGAATEAARQPELTPPLLPPSEPDDQSPSWEKRPRGVTPSPPCLGNHRNDATRRVAPDTALPSNVGDLRLLRSEDGSLIERIHYSKRGRPGAVQGSMAPPAQHGSAERCFWPKTIRSRIPTAGEP